MISRDDFFFSSALKKREGEERKAKEGFCVFALIFVYLYETSIPYTPTLLYPRRAKQSESSK